MNDELLLVLAAGTTAIVVAAARHRRFRSAVWQRTIWQAATAAVLGLLAAESVGAGGALVGWVPHRPGRRREQTRGRPNQVGQAPRA